MPTLQDSAESAITNAISSSPHERRNALICIFLLAVCVFAAYPVSSLGYSDDFSYAKTALDFAHTGHFVYNNWGAPLQGWQTVWGALFIRLFGFSFNALRLSMFPVALSSVFLIHQILLHFGISARDAVLGALTLVLTPLFMPFATSFMTDGPGIFVILLCIYMCQRAVAANSDRAAVYWLVCAAMLNLVGGMVRQTSWLGALVMVPSTGWLLRERRYVWRASVAAAFVSLLGVLACLHWASKQPNFVAEHFIVYPVSRAMVTQMLGQFARALLCLLLMVFPLVVGWLTGARRLSRLAIISISAVMCTLTVVLLHISGRPFLHSWQMPWLWDVLTNEGMADPRSKVFSRPAILSAPFRIGISVCVVGASLAMAWQIFDRLRLPEQGVIRSSRCARAAVWILGPYSLAYLVLLMPRAATAYLFDRYLLGIIPVAIVFLLLLYERQVSKALPTPSILVLGLFAIYAVGMTHNFYAEQRAAEIAIEELRAAGVPETSISQGFNRDAWVQLERQGRLEDSNHPAPDWNLPPGCVSWLPERLEPALHPTYFVVPSQTSCLVPTPYAAVGYLAWLPPFHRAVYIGRKRNSR